jgi:hypothetical protein
VLTVVKPVYYCEHCKRHRLTKHSIESHEPRCIYNPLRFACGWCSKSPSYRPPTPADFVVAFKDDPDVDRLRKQMDGCPACMLAVVVQARRLGLHDEEAWDFDYKAEVAKYRESERYEDAVAW